ncbi:Aldo/keto reductase [Ascobolus immersus RN42]|uniref:Aldo/keto reductase n=1 Tax=Ascobolus immersus RN42 TaxID=1160509 RepID=A0A3N4I6B4_ASCIM|nr:Aldo/keto reductase [Ascobolus immersus RN42]
MIINPLGFPLDRRILLNSGHSMSMLGFGTFQGTPITPSARSTVKESVLHALRTGYRHIDTAYSYGIEEEVGQALKQAFEEGIVKREEVFVTTKLHQTFHRPKDVEIGVRRSLERLKLKWVNLLLMHMPHAYVPGPDYEPVLKDDGQPMIDYEASRDYVGTWRAMEALVGEKVRSIGVSNYNILKMKRLLENCKIPPAVNQVELHPYFPQRNLVRWCRERGVVVVAHSPLGGVPTAAVATNLDAGKPLEDPLTLELAEKYHIRPSQIILSWGLQRGTGIVPKSNDPERIELNAELVELAREDFERVEGLKGEGEEVRFYNHERLIGFDIFDEKVEDRSSTRE